MYFISIGFSYTNFDNGNCKKLHKIESRPGSFDSIFLCEDVPFESECIMYSFG